MSMCRDAGSIRAEAEPVGCWGLEEGGPRQRSPTLDAGLQQDQWASGDWVGWAEFAGEGQRVGRGVPEFISFPATVVRLSAGDRSLAALSRVGYESVKGCSMGGDCSVTSQ